MDKIRTLKERIFLVGCPRSGTTLLQSLLAAHPQIASFPESHFFRHLIPEFEPKRRLLGLSSRRGKPHFQRFMREIGHEEMQTYLPKFGWFQFEVCSLLT
ncbi:MAG: sulfotransferase [Coleofasciculus sp. C2-GNP5-27]